MINNKQWLNCYLQSWRVMCTGRLAFSPTGKYVYTFSFDNKSMEMRDL